MVQSALDIPSGLLAAGSILDLRYGIGRGQLGLAKRVRLVESFGLMDLASNTQWAPEIGNDLLGRASEACFVQGRMVLASEVHFVLRLGSHVFGKGSLDRDLCLVALRVQLGKGRLSFASEACFVPQLGSHFSGRGLSCWLGRDFCHLLGMNLLEKDSYGGKLLASAWKVQTAKNVLSGAPLQDIGLRYSSLLVWHRTDLRAVRRSAVLSVVARKLSASFDGPALHIACLSQLE